MPVGDRNNQEMKPFGLDIKSDELLRGPANDADSNTIIAWAGQCIDLASDLTMEGKEAEATQHLDLAESLLTKSQENGLHPAVLANNVYYFLGSLWSVRTDLARHTEITKYFQSAESVAKTIYYYRMALAKKGRNALHIKRRGEILTNLANTLNSSGRFIEAIELWKESLQTDKKNGVTLANIGKGYLHYGQVLQDSGHRIHLWLAARELIKQGLQSDKHGMFPSAMNAFQKDIGFLNNVLGDMQPHTPNDYSLGRGSLERTYRSWVLKNVLFLNPLNDLSPESIAARDILSLPDLVVPVNEHNHSPWRHGLYDQLKQEYVSARFLFYEGTHSAHGHFSDRQVRIYNSLDYPAYGLGTEKLKAAYRALFSILDKIAVFLNFYLDLGIEEHKVHFTTFWYTDRKALNNRLRPEIVALENWPLAGIYWLSRDLVLEEGQELLEPAMRDIKDIRNALEHRFLRLHTEDSGHDIQQETPISIGLSRDAFEKKGMRLLRLVRAALIYLHGAVFEEERRKRAVNGNQSRALALLPMTMGIYEDEWKR